MKILIVSATSYEIAPLIRYMDEHAKKASFFEYIYKGHTIYPLVTGVGSLMTAFALARYTDIKQVDIAINVGLAGTYGTDFELGEVVEIYKDRFADLGVEESDGGFTDVYELGLSDQNNFPYDKGWIENKKPKYASMLPQVTGLTVNKVHGERKSIQLIKSKYTADIESMEGAGFMFACRIMDVDHHQIRAISNYVEPRNKANWQIQISIDNLNQHLITFVDQIISQQQIK